MPEAERWVGLKENMPPELDPSSLFDEVAEFVGERKFKPARYPYLNARPKGGCIIEDGKRDDLHTTCE